MMSADWLKAVHANAERNRRLLEDFDAETRAIMARNVARYLKQEKENMDKNRLRFATHLKNMALGSREVVTIASGLGIGHNSTPDVFLDLLLPELPLDTRIALLESVQRKDPVLYEEVMKESLWTSLLPIQN